MMISIEPKHLEIIKEILQPHSYNFYLFGSRVTENFKKLSDVDLFYKEEIPIQILLKIEEDFEESDLPYKVDLVNYQQCDPEFQKIMLNNCICLSTILRI